MQVNRTEFVLTTITPVITASKQSPSQTPMLTLIPSFTPTPVYTESPLACLPKSDETDFGLVKWVENGDQIVVDVQGKLQTIQYLGVMTASNSPAIELFGPPASTKSASMLVGQVVRLIADNDDKDQNGTKQRYILVNNSNVFANYELLRLGLGQVDLYLDHFSCLKTFRSAQATAKSAQLGIWAPRPSSLPTITPLPSQTRTPTQSQVPTITGTPPTTTPSLTPTITPTFTPSPSIESDAFIHTNTDFRSCLRNVLSHSLHTKKPT